MYFYHCYCNWKRYLVITSKGVLKTTRWYAPWSAMYCTVIQLIFITLYWIVSMIMQINGFFNTTRNIYITSFFTGGKKKTLDIWGVYVSQYSNAEIQEWHSNQDLQNCRYGTNNHLYSFHYFASTSLVFL